MKYLNVESEKLLKYSEQASYYRNISFGVHRTFDEQPITWDLGNNSIIFLLDYLEPYMRTLETGAGLSTFLFANMVSEHSVVTPSKDEIGRISSLFDKYKFNQNTVKFYCERSENFLPKLQCENKLDLILIDGGHGFPTPFIDFYYSSIWLKIGGILILDDIYFPATFHLFKFLRVNKHWKLEKILDGRTAVFRKISFHAGEEMQDWYSQSWYSGLKIKRTKENSNLEGFNFVNILFFPIFTYFYHIFELIFHFVIAPTYYKVIQRSYYKVIHPGFYKIIHPAFYEILHPIFHKGIVPFYYFVRKIYLHTVFQLYVHLKVISYRAFCFIKSNIRLDKIIFHYMWIYWPDSLRKKELKKRFPHFLKNLTIEDV